MSNFIDQKYIGLVSSQLELFKQINQQTYNFRCPFCGDSKRRLTKTRGYFYFRDNKWKYKCHNCGHTDNLYGVLEHVNPALLKQYTFEIFREMGGKQRLTNEKKSVKDRFLFRNEKQDAYLSTPIGELKKISQLSPDHSAKKYIVSRKIPSNRHYELFYTDNFQELANKFKPGKFNPVAKSDPRVVIPFISRDGELVAFQGRAINNSVQRYIMIVVDYDAPRYYGFNHVDLRKPVYILEGPIDSMFVKNAVAYGTLQTTAGLDEFSATEFVFVFDNQYRNKDVCRHMKRIINAGHYIVLLPNKMTGKDINEMILTGTNQRDIMSLLEKYTFKGLSASTNFKFWETGKWQ